MYKLGIDVGGTNTDAVLIDENDVNRAMRAIHGKEAQTPIAFRDRLCTSVRYRGSQARKTYMM